MTELNTKIMLYTLDEVAERFRVSRRTMVDYVQRHPFYRVLGKRKLFSEADILALYEALQCPSNSIGAAPSGTTGEPLPGGSYGDLQKLRSRKLPSVFAPRKKPGTGKVISMDRRRS